jgi:hypothetical protein
MTDLRVPTLRQPVTITCTDGRTFAGHIFMPSQSSRHQGPMRPEEWSDTVHTFFPFRARDAAYSTIFNLESVVAFSVPLDSATGDDSDDAAILELPVFRVSVDARGATFEGLVTIDMPPDHQRVADWLNAPGAFFTVRAGGAHHLIQKRHVTRVVELDRTAA